MVGDRAQCRGVVVIVVNIRGNLVLFLGGKG